MSRIVRRAHLVLVAAFGKRVADPPMTAKERQQADARAALRARAAARKRR